MARYEVREDNEPNAMPLGVATVSVHETPAEAFAAVEAEAVAYRASDAYRDGSYLQRIVVEVDGDGSERVVLKDEC